MTGRDSERGPSYRDHGDGTDRADGDAARRPEDDAARRPEGDPNLRPDGAGRPDPEEMSLEELRAEIEEIDREVVELVARRTYVAETIARVKADRGLPTVDEAQEERVMERAGENAERFGVDANLVKAVFRLLIELNKVEQRERR